jgi:outer membrane protein TolC
VSAPRLTLNLATARRIGFSPGRSLLTDAELVGVDSSGPADSLSLAETMRLASTVNLELAAADLSVAAGNQTVKRARSALLPQIESQLSQTFTREGTAQASLGQQPERMLQSGLTFSMPIFAEDAWAGYGVERHRQQAREAQRDEQRLDVVLSAATAYLNVLRARILAQVRRSDLARTRSNLEVARLREGVGSSSRADIYRWQGEVADARRELIAAESQMRVAALELKQVLGWRLDRPLGQLPVGLGDPALLAADTTVLRWFDQPVRFQALAQLLIDEALQRSPELARNDAAIAAQKREHAAASRSLYLPSLALQGGVSNVLNRGGAGSTAPTLPSTSVPVAPDMSWQVRLQVSLPLFTGMERTAARAETQLEVERLEVQRESVRLAVDQRVRASLEAAASSYAAIGLTRDAAEAAGRNYELVSDAYARGAASITTLLDAQTAALTSEESAANAVHDFLLSLMRVERAMGSFGTLQPAEQRAAFLNRLRAIKEN